MNLPTKPASEGNREKESQAKLLSREKLEPEAYRLVERLYAEHAKGLLRFGFRLTGNLDAAQDLLMETLQAAPRAVERFDRRSSMKTWLYRIALNKWREGQRSRARRQQLDLERARESYSPDLDLTIAIECEMENLSPLLLEAFVLVKIEGLRYREAADVLEVPVGTVQSRVHAACEQMRERLEGTL
jgi:RNA polymerase sigma-70 factor (ECF subfamily)